MKKFNDFVNESGVPSSGLMQISLDLYPDGDFMKCLQELIEQFDLQIVNLWPMGPGGGNAEVTFRGRGEDIMDLVKWYCELSGDDDPRSFYDQYAHRDAPISFEVQSDSRFVTYKNREFVNVNGTPIQ
jgi:hypothetical protein